MNTRNSSSLARLVSRVLMFFVFCVLVLLAFVIGCLAYPATATIWFMWGCYVGDQDNIKYCLDPFDFAVWTARKLRATDGGAIAANDKADLAPASGAQVQRLDGQTEPRETKP